MFLLVEKDLCIFCERTWLKWEQQVSVVRDASKSVGELSVWDGALIKKHFVGTEVEENIKT